MFKLITLACVLSALLADAKPLKKAVANNENMISRRQTSRSQILERKATKTRRQGPAVSPVVCPQTGNIQLSFVDGTTPAYVAYTGAQTATGDGSMTVDFSGPSATFTLNGDGSLSINDPSFTSIAYANQNRQPTSGVYFNPQDTIASQNYAKLLCSVSGSSGLCVLSCQGDPGTNFAVLTPPNNGDLVYVNQGNQPDYDEVNLVVTYV